jgi:rhodanese-related sulfurtransferase
MTDSTLPIEITCRDVAARRQVEADLLLLDCRERDEYQRVHIAGAMLLPMSEAAARAGEFEPFRDRAIVVYCHLGGRSLQVATWLRKLGFSRVQSMAGGIDAWAVDVQPGMVRY